MRRIILLLICSVDVLLARVLVSENQLLVVAQSQEILRLRLPVHK